jgi:serine/threonine protein kinase
MKIMKSLNHQNVMFLKAAWTDKKHYFMLFEYALNGDLTNFLATHGALSIEMTRFMSAHIINGLEYLRSKRIVHRDLKPANIVLNEKWQPLLADFGTAKTMIDSGASANSGNSYLTISDNVSHVSATSAISDLSAGQSVLSSDRRDFLDQFQTPQAAFEDSEAEEEESDEDEIVGTVGYYSPEMIKDQNCSYSADLWALGVMIYQMITGETPFNGSPEKINKAILTGKFIIPSSVPEAARDLISRLLVIKAEERLGATNIQDLKSHAFFKNVNFSSLGQEKVPMDLELNKAQKVTKRHLPKYNKRTQAAVMPSSPRFAASQEPYSAEKAERKQLKIANSFSLLTVKQEQQNDTNDNSMARHGAICTNFNLSIRQQCRSEDQHSADNSPISGYNVSEEGKSSYSSSSFSTSSNDDVNH